MKFIILTYESAADFEARRAGSGYWERWAAFGGALKSAGVVSEMHGLEGVETASTVRLRGGEAAVVDGPLLGGNLQLGGYFILDVADAAEAQVWAARCPAAVNGAVEGAAGAAVDRSGTAQRLEGSNGKIPSRAFDMSDRHVSRHFGRSLVAGDHPRHAGGEAHLQ